MMKFKKCAKNERISCKSIVCLNVSTRWNSMYMMFETAIKFARAFVRLEDDEDAYRNDSPPTKEDWLMQGCWLCFLKCFTLSH